MTSKDIKSFCLSLGLDAVGIAPAQLPAENVDAEICPLATGQGRERYEPEKILPGAKSLIVVLFPYFCGYPTESNLSLYTHSLDYHTIIRNYLHKIGDFMKETEPLVEYVPVVDTSPLADRYMARMAGLGFIGDNQCLIHENYGSYCFIGTIVTTAVLEIDTPSTRECIHCRRCKEICPGRCFDGKNYDYRLCKSYLTQKKGDLSSEEIRIIRKTPYIFGCDECQRVCAHNRTPAPTPIPEFRQNLLTRLDIAVVAAMTNKEFKEAYGKRAFAWRGKKILIRNDGYIKSTPED